MHNAHVHAQACLSLLLCSADVYAGGILIASKQMPYLVGVMTIALAAMAGYMALVRANDWGLGGVWWGLCLFFAVRVVQSVWKVYTLYYTLPREEESSDEGNLPVAA